MACAFYTGLRSSRARTAVSLKEASCWYVLTALSNRFGPHMYEELLISSSVYRYDRIVVRLM